MMHDAHRADYPQAMSGVRAAVATRSRLLQWLGRQHASKVEKCPKVMSMGLRAARDGDLAALKMAVGGVEDGDGDVC